uniref:Type III restriction enzyme, res subunit n=1 Tax=Megaviridae environmental sample TaxID=1737588 RepID=A0A5J6VHV6_9VIRU|nr:MAG: type III restriction enzyme, res subunit [Megaviridae environmental sample]
MLIKNIPEHRKALTVKPHSTSRKFKQPPYYVYRLISKQLKVPKFWWWWRNKIPPPTPKPKYTINSKFTGELGSHQKMIVNTIIPKIKERGGGILSVPCGGGKTIMALYIATKLKLKTLIVVPMTILLNQWMDAIKSFTNISPGMIQGATHIDGDIVVGMMHSLARRDYTLQFDMLIVDEVHDIATKGFINVLHKISTPFTLGLSATPKRKDKCEKVFMWFLGGILWEEKRKNAHNVIVKKVPFKINKSDAFNDLLNKENLSRMRTILSKITSRNKLIVAWVGGILERSPSRNILILSDRIEQLWQLNIAFRDRYPQFSSGVLMGPMKHYQRRQTLKRRVIFASMKIAKEGFDHPDLDTLILASPSVDVEQATGRILRKDTGHRPLIIDIVDSVVPFNRWWHVRLKYYKQVGFTIKDKSSKRLYKKSINK